MQKGFLIQQQHMVDLQQQPTQPVKLQAWNTP